MKRNLFSTCFCATCIALVLSSCRNPEKVQTATSEKIASGAVSTVTTSFASDQTHTQSPEQNFITVDANQGVEAETKIEKLKNAIKLADDIDREVHQSLNSDILSKAYTGVELQKKQAFVNGLKSHKAYIYSKLRRQVFHNFQISADGSTAKVDLTETWSHKIFSQETNELLAKSPATDVPQTNYLQKSKDGWIIYSTVYGSNPPAFKVLAKSP